MLVLDIGDLKFPGPVEFAYAWEALQNNHVDAERGKNFRDFDGLKATPLTYHSWFAANAIALEPQLPLAVRILGANVLLLHDVGEDSKLGLPRAVHPLVKEYVLALTSNGSSAQAMQEIWTKPELARLFKLYDLWSNAFDGFFAGGWMHRRGTTYRSEWIGRVLPLVDFVETSFLPQLSEKPILGSDVNVIRALRSLAA